MTRPRKTNARPRQRGPLARLFTGRPAAAASGGHRYHCGVCRTTYGPAPTADDARALRAVHRRQHHGGGRPDGERIISPPPSPPGLSRLDLWLFVFVAIFVAAVALTR